MWECKECGQENDDSLPHCMSCGVEREGSTAPPPAPRPEPAPVPAAPTSEWELTRTVARIVSFLGWATVVFGFVGIPIFNRGTEIGTSDRPIMLFAMMLQVAGVCTTGLVLVLFGHVARAVVEILESKRT